VRYFAALFTHVANDVRSQLSGSYTGQPCTRHFLRAVRISWRTTKTLLQNLQFLTSFVIFG